MLRSKAVADGLEILNGHKCESCDEILEEGSAIEVPLYECGSCGTIFNRDNSADGDSHRCPDCNKFGSKVSDTSCSECQEGEVIEIEYVENDGELEEIEEDHEQKS